jgi:conjugal transfer/entry exclusion protein
VSPILTCNSAHWRPAAKKLSRAKSHYQSDLAHLGAAPKVQGALLSAAEEGRAFLAMDFSDCRAGTIQPAARCAGGNQLGHRPSFGPSLSGCAVQGIRCRG